MPRPLRAAIPALLLLGVWAVADPAVSGPSGPRIAAGAAHTLVVRADGTLWAWGENGAGQLGDGSGTSWALPARVGRDTDWAAVSAGREHTLALKRDGTLWAWGNNNYGRLGDGTTEYRPEPVRVGRESDWVEAVAGWDYSAARRRDGSLWLWGWNRFSQLGDGADRDRHRPGRLEGPTVWAGVDAGLYHTVAVSAQGALWAWGDGGYGQLGDGTTYLRPRPVRIGGDSDWARASASGYHTLLLKRDGTLWATGGNGFGQVGDGGLWWVGRPKAVGPPGARWGDVAAGWGHSAAVDADGRLWTWGANESGQLGRAPSQYELLPAPVGEGAGWASVALGSYHTAALREDGSVWAWGGNQSGQLGDGSRTGRWEPLHVFDAAAPVNYPPRPRGGPLASGAGVPSVARLAHGDPDAGDAHAWRVAEPPRHGTATLLPEGLLTYVPEAGFAGEDRLVVAVADRAGAEGRLVLPVTVSPPPEPSAAAPKDEGRRLCFVASLIP